jgi:hypothetical protein
MHNGQESGTELPGELTRVFQCIVSTISFRISTIFLAPSLTRIMLSGFWFMQASHSSHMAFIAGRRCSLGEQRLSAKSLAHLAISSTTTARSSCLAAQKSSRKLATTTQSSQRARPTTAKLKRRVTQEPRTIGASGCFCMTDKKPLNQPFFLRTGWAVGPWCSFGW